MKNLKLPKFQRFSLKELWRQVKAEFKKDTGDPLRLAMAVGLGLAFGVSPFWGFQMLSAYAVASFVKLNRVVVLAATYISNPPTIPVIIYLSFIIGAWFLPVEYQADLSKITDVDSIGQNLFQYLIGSFLMSTVLGVGGTFISYFIILRFRRKRQALEEMPG